MRIGVFGVGGIGGYFGGRLAAAGEEVHFLARGAHGRALAEQGLTIKSPLGDAHVDGLSVSDDPASLADCDLVMHCTKLWDLEESGRTLAAVLPEDALVVPFQNGVEAAETLAASLGQARVAQGIALISATIEAPGVIRHANTSHRLSLGARLPEQQPRLEAFCAAGQAAGFEAVMSRDLAGDLWRKMIMLTALAGTTGSRRSTMGMVRNTPSGRSLMASLVAEAAAVARAEGAALPEKTEATTLAILESMPEGVQASLAIDLARGHRLELPWLNGTILRLARKHGLAVPTTERVVAALAPFQEGRAHGS